MSQTRQGNGILRRCAKGHRDVQNAARAAEKNAPNVTCEKHGVKIWAVHMVTQVFLNIIIPYIVPYIALVKIYFFMIKGNYFC